jgi:hypothetical protein
VTGVKANEASRWVDLVIGGRLNIVRACRSAVHLRSSRVNVLCDQVLDSVIVAGITAVSAFIYAGEDVSLKAAALSFLLTFLIKMKEYRKIA